jgi:hypothetical protein
MAADATERWLEMYVRAWTTNDVGDIRALFSDDASYFPTPFSPGWHGVDDIVAGWLERKDEPGDWSFEYEVLCGSDGHRPWADDLSGLRPGFRQSVADSFRTGRSLPGIHRMVDGAQAT